MNDEAEREKEVFFLILTAPPLDDVNRVGYDSCPLFLSLNCQPKTDSRIGSLQWIFRRSEIGPVIVRH